MPDPDDPSLDVVRVLLVEDSAADATLLEDLLDSPGGERLALHWVRTLAAARLALEESTPGCVLLDLGLPDASGLEGLHALRAQRPDVPIVLLTGVSDRRLALSAVADGAQDSVTKGVLDADGVKRAVRCAIQRHRAAGALGRRAFESLTGLGNRALLVDQIDLIAEPAR